MSYRYDPYRDRFEHIDDERPISASGTATLSWNQTSNAYKVVQLTELTDECVEKIADAVAKRLKEE